jgi:hypothetical protein
VNRTQGNKLIIKCETGICYVIDEHFNLTSFSVDKLDYDELNFVGNKIITSKLVDYTQTVKLYNYKLMQLDSIIIPQKYSYFKWKTTLVYSMDNYSINYFNCGSYDGCWDPFYGSYYQVYFPKMNDSSLDTLEPGIIDTPDPSDPPDDPPDPPDTTNHDLDTIVYKINTSFPNPAEDYVKIETELLENLQIEVWDTIGNLIPLDFSKTKRKDKYLLELKISALPKGTYYYKISGKGKIFRGLFLKI